MKEVNNKTDKEIQNHIYLSIKNCLEEIHHLDIEKLEEIIRYIASFKKIIFLGSEMSLNVAYLWQLEMVNASINAYCFSDPSVQYEITKETDDCLFIVLSCTGDWYKANQELLDLLDMKKDKILFTTQIDTKYDYNYVYQFGTQSMYAHNNLMYFIPLCRDLFIQILNG